RQFESEKKKEKVHSTIINQVSRWVMLQITLHNKFVHLMRYIARGRLLEENAAIAQNDSKPTEYKGQLQVPNSKCALKDTSLLTSKIYTNLSFLVFFCRTGF